MGTFSRTMRYIYIYDSRFRKNYALISHERKRRILSQILFKSPPMTLFLPLYLCKSLASLCKFHEFGTTIRNWSSAFTKLQNSNPKPTNILENFINRAYYVYKFNPCRSEEPSITGKNHGRKKKKKEKKKLLSKLAASLARKSLRAQFSRPIETRFRPIHPPPSSPPLFPSRGKRLLIRARRTSALLAGRRRGGEERVLRVRAARGRTQG